MTINGKEYGFVYNIYARCEMDREVKKTGYSNLGEMIAQAYNRAIVLMAVCMSRGYEYAKSAENPGYKKDPITEAKIMTLPAIEYAQLDAEVNAAFAAGSKRTVEEEPPKRKNGKSAQESN